MISHFLIRDLNTHRLSWLVLILISLLLFPATWMGVDFLALLGYLYFLFPMIVLQQISGVNWRSQNIMSRNYLMALPIPRQVMFRWVVIRALVFCIPAFLFSVFAPVYWEQVYDFLMISSFMYIYIPIVFSLFVWFICIAISMQLGIERITTYLTLQERMWEWTKYFIIHILEAMVVVTNCIFLAEITPPWFPLIGALVIARVRYGLTRKLWLGN